MPGSSRRWRAGPCGVAVLAAALLAGCSTSALKPAGDDWPLHGLDPGGQRFSGLAQIDRSGAQLWVAQCDAGVNAPPATYRVDGCQYVAVAAGGNALFGFKQGDELRVFALPR